MNLQALFAGLLRYDRWLFWLGLPVLAAGLHWQVWDMELRGMHVWRQTQTQQAIDAFVNEDFNILNPRRLERGAEDGILRLEFPLYQWITAAFGKVFGNTIFLSRWMVFMLSFLAAIGMERVVYALTKSRLAAYAGAFFFMFSPLVFFYGVSVMPDMLALCLAVWGLAFSLAALREFSWGKWIAGAALIGLGTLVKLPFIVFGAAFFPLLLRVFSKDQPILVGKWLAMCLVLLLAMVPAFAWYAAVMPSWGPAGIESELLFHPEKWDVLKEILIYHFWQVLPRSTTSILSLPFILIGGFFLFQNRAENAELRRMLWPVLALGIGFFCFWIYALGIIGIPHDYYFLPFVPVVSSIAALGVWQAFKHLPKWTKPLLMVLILATPYMAYRRVAERWDVEKPEFNRELFLHQNALRDAVPNDALVIAGPDLSHMIFLYYIDKKGWSWDENQGLGLEKIKDWQSKGAKYLYCDDRAYDELPELMPVLGKAILQYGSIKIYQLKD